MLFLGKSKSWRSGHQYITGRSTVTANAMLQYFRPLEQWLKDKNSQLGITIGWNETCAPESYRSTGGKTECVTETEECDKCVQDDVADWIIDFIRKLRQTRNNG